jgi:predicted kinase
VAKRAIIFIGIPASGKTAYYRQHFGDFAHVNLDTLRTRYRERIEIERLVKLGLNYVIDNTNPQKSDRARYIPQAKEAGYQVDGYFFHSDVKECIKRNDMREGKARIPARAVAAISNRLEMPALDEGFDNLHFVRMRENGFITDIGG